jgi:hypothetical protein
MSDAIVTWEYEFACAAAFAFVLATVARIWLCYPFGAGFAVSASPQLGPVLRIPASGAFSYEASADSGRRIGHDLQFPLEMNPPLRRGGHRHAHLCFADAAALMGAAARYQAA